ncbi:hypothetical protein ACOTJD_06680 [Achromobacter xylosoxidans]|jgi:hypothetical protein
MADPSTPTTTAVTTQTDIPISYLPGWVTDTASVASVVGFLLTLYVSWSIRTIRRKYARKWRIPKIMDQTKALGSELAIYLSEKDLKMEVSLVILRKLKVLIYTAIEHSEGEAKREVRKFHQNLGNVISQLSGGRVEDEAQALWDCYGRTLAVLVHLQQSLDNDEWK